MKKIFLSFILSIFFISSITVNAQNFVPRYVNMLTSTSTPTLQAGSDFSFDVTMEKSDLPEGKTNIEYGVVKRIVQGNMIAYEPISVLKTDKSYSSSRTQKITAKVPNVLKNNDSTTYVVYAKITVVDDVDAENFIVAKQYFKIQDSENIPTTKIRYMNFLHSNGKRYGLLTGPSIYDLSKTTYKGVASSTSLDIVFNSNVDITLNPNITFKKLRSDAVIPDLKPEPINITKGTSTIALIPLPNFDYDPGVYQGTIDFGNKDILNVDFQYIVNGDAVTFGQPVYSKTKENNQILDFKIFGTPVDLNLDPILNNLFSTSTSTSTVYATEFIIKDKDNKELWRTNQNIDFSTTTYRLEIPGNIKNVARVSIKTVNVGGTVLYESTKDLNIPKDNTLKSVLLTTLFALVVLMILIFKHKYIRVILFIIALTVLGFWVSTAKAGVWKLPFYSYLYSYTGDMTYVSQSNWVAQTGSLLQFNTDIVNERYYTDEEILITYQAIHEYCYNQSWENLYMAFSFYSNVIASNNSLHYVTDVRGGSALQAVNYSRFLANNPWYMEFMVDSGVSTNNLDQSKALAVFANEYEKTTGNHFYTEDECWWDDDEYLHCGESYPYNNDYNDYLIALWVSLPNPTLVTLLNVATGNLPGYFDTCYDYLNCGGDGFQEQAIGSGRRYVVTRWVTENLGVPPSTTPYVWVRRATFYHNSDIRYAIPLLNVVDRNGLAVTVDNITKNSARVNWAYNNPKPQTNYQVELSTSNTFSTILQNKSYSPVTVNTFDKYLTKINNILGIKKLDAATTVDTVRDVTFDGLSASTTYYVRVRVQNSDGWGNHVPASFTTLPDTNSNCICSGRDLVCVQNGVTSTTTASATCKLAASCGVTTNTTDTIFTIIPTNLLGTASYTQTSGNTATRAGGVFTAMKTASVQSIAVTVTDSYDGQTASASCSIDNTGAGIPPVGPPITPPIVPPGPTYPRIIINKIPRISLNSGGHCTIGWTLVDIPSTVTCTLTGTDEFSEVLTETGSHTFGPLTSNQKYTATCSGPDFTTLSVSTICRVNGEVREK